MEEKHNEYKIYSYGRERIDYQNEVDVFVCPYCEVLNKRNKSAWLEMCQHNTKEEINFLGRESVTFREE